MSTATPRARLDSAPVPTLKDVLLGLIPRSHDAACGWSVQTSHTLMTKGDAGCRKHGKRP